MKTARGRNKLKKIEASVNKELFAFSTSAVSLVEHSRRLRDVIVAPEFEEKRTEIFNAPMHRFITELRNLISHRRFPNIGWVIQYGEETTTDFVLPTRDLLAQPDIHTDARAYISSCEAKIYVRPVVNAYAGNVLKFYSWYLNSIGENVSPSLADYRRIQKACKATSSRAIYKILLTQLLSAKTDPYQYLDRFLLPEQIEAALKLPSHTKEQSDFIISVVDEYGACDNEIRQLVYKLFNVDG